MPPRPSLVLSYKGLIPDAELLSWAKGGLVAGIVLFRDNCSDEPALSHAIKSLRAASTRPLRIMIDEEGGRVRRLPDADASMRDLRDYEREDPKSVALAYLRTAARLRQATIDTLLAPVVDIGDSSSEWLRSRTYSDSAMDVAVMAAEMIPTVQAHGVNCCAKHFPGTGRVQLDPHHGPVVSLVTRSEWDKHEAAPFRAAIAAGVWGVLVGHQIMKGFGEKHPACFSRPIVAGILRQDLGFRGMILTDDLAMDAIGSMGPIELAVNAALDAGCDLILVCNDRDLQRRAIGAWQARAES